MSVREALANLLDVLQADLLHRRLDTEVLCDERNEILKSWPRTRPPQTTLVAQRLPACDFLDVTEAAAAHAPTHNIVAGLAPLLDLLPWSYSYPVHPKWPELADHVAFAEIIGSRGLADGDGIHLGLTLMAPRTHYPMHSHPAIELYLVLSGIARWRVAGESFKSQVPGSLILHPSGIGHAMVTDAEPLLALYVWRGDLVSPSVFTDEP